MFMFYVYVIFHVYPFFKKGPLKTSSILNMTLRKKKKRQATKTENTKYQTHRPFILFFYPSKSSEYILDRPLPQNLPTASYWSIIKAMSHLFPGERTPLGGHAVK